MADENMLGCPHVCAFLLNALVHVAGLREHHSHQACESMITWQKRNFKMHAACACLIMSSDLVQSSFCTSNKPVWMGCKLQGALDGSWSHARDKLR